MCEIGTGFADTEDYPKTNKGEKEHHPWRGEDPEKKGLLKNITELIDKVMKLINKVKEATYLQKKLTTTLFQKEETKAAVELALMDSEILFTTLTQNMEEIINKHLKSERISDALVDAYKTFKLKRD